MRTTLKEKLEMCEEHIFKGKSLSHVSKKYDGYDIENLKYISNLYKRHGKRVFLDKEIKTYKRDVKLWAINIVNESESKRNG